MKSTGAGAVIAFSFLAANVAGAQEYPKLSVDADLAFQSEKSLTRVNGRSPWDSFVQVETGLGLFLDEEWSIRGVLKLEPVRGTTASRFLEDEGLWIEELFIDYRGEVVGLFAGKFNPSFGTAWDRLSDLFQKSFAADYERTEGLGAGFALRPATPGWGEHELTAALFHFDNTFLSNSALARPRRANDDTLRVKRNRQSFGGPGNTRDFSSYTLTLEGEGFPGFDGLSYHLGHSSLARGASETHAEKGYAAALHWAVDLAAGVVVTPMVELAHLRHALGGSEHRTYLTTAIEIGWSDWRLVGTRTSRHVDEPADGSGAFGRDYTDSLISLLLSYTFDFGLEVMVAWKRERAEGASLLHAIGTRFSYGLKF